MKLNNCKSKMKKGSRGLKVNGCGCKSKLFKVGGRIVEMDCNNRIVSAKYGTMFGRYVNPDPLESDIHNLDYTYNRNRRGNNFQQAVAMQRVPVFAPDTVVPVIHDTLTSVVPDTVIPIAPDTVIPIMPDTLTSIAPDTVASAVQASVVQAPATSAQTEESKTQNKTNTKTRSASNPAQIAKIKTIQNYLNDLGYDVGTADGIIGKKLQLAILQLIEDMQYKNSVWASRNQSAPARTVGVSVSAGPSRPGADAYLPPYLPDEVQPTQDTF